MKRWADRLPLSDLRLRALIPSRSCGDPSDLASFSGCQPFGAGFAAALPAESPQGYGVWVLFPLDRLFLGFLANGQIYNPLSELVHVARSRGAALAHAYQYGVTS